jgi:hypothetical protein
MMSGGLLRVTVTVCCVLALAVAAVSAVAGRPLLGLGVAAGLLLGSLNGYLIQTLLVRRAPFVAGSLLRLVVLSAFAVGAAMLLPGAGWSVAMGIATAQLVMVGAGVRQGLRA